MGFGGRIRRAWRRAGAGAVVALALGVAPAQAQTPYRDIASAGPIQNVYIGNELSCQVQLKGDSDLSFYPAEREFAANGAIPGDCGTFVAAGGSLYAPDFQGHTHSAAEPHINSSVPLPEGTVAYTPFTPVSQTPVSGTGTNEDPFAVTTIASAGTSGLSIAQRDSYQPGESFYTTEVTVSNSSAGVQAATLYHAGDCYLQNDDFGFGHLESSTGGTFCTRNPNNQPAGRIIGFVPFEPATRLEAYWILNWNAIVADGAPLAGTCACFGDAGQKIDNGAALAWQLAVPANGSVTRSFITTLSASGVDDDPPETKITKGPFPDQTLTVETANFEFGADEPGSTFQCSIDGGAFGPCTTPLTTAALIDGGHRFAVRATDPHGNTDPTPAVRDFGTLTKPCAGKQVTIYTRFEEEVVEGTPGDDVILGGPLRDVVISGAGNDTVCDREGNDVIDGGPGKDKLRGGPDDDEIAGGGGADILSGRDGSDALRGGPGADFLNGNPGADSLHGGGGKDRCKGGAGRDTEKACERT